MILRIERVARILYLTAFDNTASAVKAWDGDGTKENLGHAKRKDRAYRKYCQMAEAAIDDLLD